MVHHDWFPLKPWILQSEANLAPGLTEGRPLALALMNRGLVRGELDSVAKTPTGLKLRINRPGTAHECSYNVTTGIATIRTTRQPFLGVLNRLHHTAGLWHEGSLALVWNGFVSLISLALLGLGCTGIYLWFVRRQDRAIGFVLLGINLVATIALLILIRKG
jgi:hypothetical protein